MIRLQLAVSHWIGALILATSLGCGGMGEEGTVRGSVLRDGKPQQGVRIGFVAQVPADPSTSGGTVTNAEGKFEITLSAGNYKVTLSRLVDKDGKVPGESADPTKDYTQLAASGLLREEFPTSYTQVESTPLTVEIPAGGRDLPPFEVSQK